jgi:Matrixin
VSRTSRQWLAALMAASVVGAASSAFAWEPLAGTRELAPRWSGPLVYRLNKKGSDDLDLEVVLAEVHKGMLQWTTPNCTSATARYDGLTDELPSTADEPGSDNVIAWSESDWTHGPEAVAVTAPSFISTGSGKPPAIVAATMWLNGKHWTWITGATEYRRINAFSVFLHEGGHYWGLEHTAVPMSVMNKSYSGDLTGLASDDIEGICSLYPLGAVDDCTKQPCADGYDCAMGNCLWDGVGTPQRDREMDGGCGEVEHCDGGTPADDVDHADGCEVDHDCAGDNERCVAGHCMHLADPPRAMCMRDGECGADEACKAGTCVADDPARAVGLPVGSDCVMDSDCESGLCRFSGEATQCTDFCETDRDCGEAGRCQRDGRKTGLCRSSGLAPEPDSTPPPRTDRHAEDSGCSAAGSSATASMLWLLIIPWLLRRARRASQT